MTVKVRFAPSPTGKLHVGNVRAALLNWLFASQQGGVFMLRSDDTDQARSTRAFEQQIEADLAWLGLTHSEYARQSERFDAYDAAAAWLKEQGLLYPCYETPEELDRKRKLQQARKLPPVYDRTGLNETAEDRAAHEAAGRKPHWRFKLSQEPVVWNDLIRGETKVDTGSVSDPVLIREDGMYLYTLPSCVDDVDFGITHVIRGEDHVTNTATQVELFRALISMKGSGAVPAFAHHSLMVGKDGEKLSKRLDSLTIESLREHGLEPAAVTSLLARLGTSDPVEPFDALPPLVESFSFDKMGRAPARFDPEELEAVNAKIVHDLPFSAVEARVPCDAATWDIVRENITKVSDVHEWLSIIDGPVTPVMDDPAVTDAAAAALPDGALTRDSWKALTDAVKAETGAKGKGLFMPLRKALTGQERGPDMADLFPLIGREKAQKRLRGETA